MEIIVSALILMFSQQVEVEDYHNRVDSNTLTRIKKVLPQVHQASNLTGTPPKYLLGTIYNETNARPDLIGDGGISYGLGQIQCRVWFRWLQKREGLQHLKRCNQLLRSYTNLKAVGYILKHLKDRGGSWDNALEAYHTGQFIPGNGDRKYKNRTLYFGQLFLPYYNHYEKLQPYIRTLRKWSNTWGERIRKL